jgi:alpha-L-fucosidase 2
MIKNILFYDKPASAFENGMPLGNGRLGAMLVGGADSETIFLNEDTLWSGYPTDYTDSQAYSWLDKIRKLIFEGALREAEKLIDLHLSGRWTEAYMPMAVMHVECPELRDSHIENYNRRLDLHNGVASVSFTASGVEYRKEAFCSFPDQALIVKLCSTEPSTWVIRLSSLLKNTCGTEVDCLYLEGCCPETVHEEEVPGGGEAGRHHETIRYRVAVKAVSSDGTVTVQDGSMRAENCRELVLLVSSANSFVRYDHRPDGEYRRQLRAYLCSAAKKGYDELLMRHAEDFSTLFDRVELELGHTANEELPFDERLLRFERGEQDPELIATAFQFGRYLLISSSRGSTEPANLQGIWNDKALPPWNSNYTVNINTEMNYWAAEKCNLTECTDPLVKFIAECAESGEKTARVNYHCRGWCVHHNVDLWRKTTPVGSLDKTAHIQPYGLWLAGGGWFCRHLWDHYLYTCDAKFLSETAFPIMLRSAAFYLDWMVAKDGFLYTCPSSSPENMYILNGYTAGITYASTMDNEVIRELFSNCERAAKTLVNDGRSLSDRERAVLKEISEALPRIPGFRIGKNGQLQEWIRDYEENEITHRHLSPLYALYPSNQITAADKTLSEACKTTLQRRGDGGTGWSRAWKICLYARLHDADKALNEIIRYLQFANDAGSKEISYTDGGITENLFPARPMQADGAFGFTAGIAEMLLQDQNGVVECLPAIPGSWKEGYVKGLRLQGGGVIDICWKSGKKHFRVIRPDGSSYESDEEKNKDDI